MCAVAVRLHVVACALCTRSVVQARILGSWLWTGSVESMYDMQPWTPVVVDVSAIAELAWVLGVSFETPVTAVVVEASTIAELGWAQGVCNR